MPSSNSGELRLINLTEISYTKDLPLLKFNTAPEKWVVGRQDKPFLLGFGLFFRVELWNFGIHDNQGAQKAQAKALDMTARLGCKANGLGAVNFRKKNSLGVWEVPFKVSIHQINIWKSTLYIYVVLLFSGVLYWKAFFRLRIGVNWILNRWYAVESYQEPVPKSRIDRIDGCWVAQWHSQITQMAKWWDMSDIFDNWLYVSRFQILWQYICQMDVKYLAWIWKSLFVNKCQNMKCVNINSWCISHCLQIQMDSSKD